MILTPATILGRLKKILQEEFECPICLELCDDTLQLQHPDCGHRFCKICIKESMSKCNNECPTCRLKISTYRSFRADSFFDKVSERLLKELVEPLEQQIKECKGREKTEKIEISRKKRSRSMSCSSNTISSEICEEENSAARESKHLRPSHRNEQETFSNYFKLLMEFKAEFGHCEVPPALARSNDSKYSSLALWCTKIQQCYKTMKLGKKSRVQSFTTLSASRIRRLEAAGFEWKFSKKECTFDNHIKQLVAYKAEFGHCDVPRKVSRHSRYYGLSQWCNSIRSKGRKPTDLNLSPAKIRRLESIGFRLKLMTFDDYFTQLEEYKAEFGHCNVPYDRSDDYDLLSNEEDSSKHKALMKWCFAIRSSSTMAEEEGEQPRCSKLSPSQIQRLEDLGFHFDMPKTRDFSFYERFEVLMKYKAEFGNVDVPSGMSRDSRYYLLSRWCCCGELL